MVARIVQGQAYMANASKLPSQALPVVAELSMNSMFFTESSCGTQTSSFILKPFLNGSKPFDDECLVSWQFM